MKILFLIYISRMRASDVTADIPELGACHTREREEGPTTSATLSDLIDAEVARKRQPREIIDPLTR